MVLTGMGQRCAVQCPTQQCPTHFFLTCMHACTTTRPHIAPHLLPEITLGWQLDASEALAS